MDDKRHFPRVADESRLTWKVVDEPSAAGEVGPALAVNISGGGVCFRAAEPLRAGQLLALELQLPGFPASVIALARVVWCEPSDHPQRPYDVGAEFHWVGWDSQFAQAQIASYIREKLAL